METFIANNTLELRIESNLYSQEVIYKCFYWYTKNFDVTIESVVDKQWVIKLETADESFDFTSAIRKIKRDLIDFRLREIVFNETKVIRELMIAKAFANYDIDEPPTTDVSDPVGFDPLQI